MKPSNVLVLPGWQNSGPDHWQSRWERLHGDERVVQHDWDWPRRGDWMARLDEVLLHAAVAVARLPAALPVVGARVLPAGQQQDGGGLHYYQFNSY